ncbi:MAG: elongation factor G [Eubacteriales bacterium]|nr:elongation factor G [Eubacteriales bacterium]
MKVYKTKDIRNVAFLGHGGEGKTSLAEAILYNAKAIERMGKTTDGTTVMDFDAEEKKRQISISTAVASAEWNGTKINIIDVPGFFDFVGEMTEALEAADSAIIVVGAVSGVSVGTEKAWDACTKKRIPKLVFVNQTDRENASYSKVVKELREKYGNCIAPIEIPIMEGETMKGYVDVIHQKAYAYSDKGPQEIPVPAALTDELADIRQEIMESAAENDEELLEKYFETSELSDEEIARGISLGVAAHSTVPVVAGSALQNRGVVSLMNHICALLPSPDTRKPASGVNPKNGQKEERKCDETAPFSAQVFKTIADPFVGKLSIFKVLSGKLNASTNLYNGNAEKSEKSGSLYTLKGGKQLPVDELVAGDIGAMAKLQYTMTGHTLCEAENPIVYPEFVFPKTALTMAISVKKEGEEDKVFGGLNRLMEEDPTFALTKDPDTGEMLIKGMGELHLEVITKRLQNKFGVEAVLKEPIIPYRETIRKCVEAEGRHKKQSGGAGQFGVVSIRFEPITDGSAEFEFVDKIVGGVVPREYIPAVEKGLRESIKTGVLAGYPMVNLRAILFDGKYHPVDSKEIAFKTAARLAYKKACREANPVLLEPIYNIKVSIPDAYMGDIIGDLNRRRGRILGMHPGEDGMQVVEAEVPLAELSKYATDLRSMTQARGEFEMEYVRYEDVPGNIAAKIIETASIASDEDDE